MEQGLLFFSDLFRDIVIAWIQKLNFLFQLSDFFFIGFVSFSQLLILLFAGENELFILSNFTSLFLYISLKSVDFLLQIQYFLVVFFLWNEMSCVFLVHFSLKFCQLFTSFLGLFFILFLKFWKLVSFYW